MKKTGRGYEMPLAVNREERIKNLAVSVLGSIFCTRLAFLEGKLMWLLPAIMMALVLGCGGGLLARLHILPEGVSITLFGRTLRCIPAEQIRVIGGVRSYLKYDTYDLIALCTDTAEELSWQWKKRTPQILQNAIERYSGENAGQFLFRRRNSLSGGLNLQKGILWLDWDVERIKLLLEMYPNAQWIDCTRERIFEEQLKP